MDNHHKIKGINIETPLEYWQIYWRRMSHKFRDNEFDLFPLESPHFLIDMIISEIDYQGLQNKVNCKLFQERLCYLLKEEVVFKDLFYKKINLIISNILNTNKTQYVKMLCNEIQKDFENGEYFKALIDHTGYVIKRISTLDKKSRCKINYYTFLIISEFIAKGYDPEDIESLSTSYPDIIQQAGGCVISAPKSILGISLDEFSDKEAYYAKLEEIVSNLNIDNWLEVVRNLYFQEAEPAFFIVRLNGLKGCSEYSINGITIYNPSKKQYITDEESRKYCPLEQASENREYLNIALPIEYKFHFTHTAKNKAFSAIEQLVDLLSIHFADHNVSFDKENYIIVHNGFPCAGNIVGEWKQPHEYLEYISAKDISSSEQDFSLILERFNTIRSCESLNDKRLINAIHWLNKGLKSSSWEDKLLYHWIALESVLNIGSSFRANICNGDISTIDYIIRNVKAINYSCYYKTPLYSYYDYLLMSINSRKNYFGLPETIINDAALNLKPYDKYKLRSFYDHLPQIIENINDDVFKNEIERVYNFYTLDGFDEYEKNLSRNITLIYRFRNLIAHNATFPQYIIKYYAEDIEMITLRIVRKLIDVCRINETTLENTILNCVIKYDIFKSNLRDNIQKFIIDF